MNHPRDLLRLMRPWQWIKNGFVFVGIIFSQQLQNIPLLQNVVLTFFAFCMASSAVYIFNDIIDSEKDKQHPKKKHRPLPAGKVSKRSAALLAGIICLMSLTLSITVSFNVMLIVLGYLMLNVLYTFWLKHIAILDVFCIATGFILRIMAGTLGVGIPPSHWLLLCSLMVTLFLGFAKRRAEIIALAHNKGEHRRVLLNYNKDLLDQLIGICATAVILSYSLYTMSPETIQIHHTSHLIYTIPFVIYAIFRYLYLLHRDEGGGDPSRDLVRDRHIILSVFGWTALSIYLLSH